MDPRNSAPSDHPRGKPSTADEVVRVHDVWSYALQHDAEPQRGCDVACIHRVPACAEECGEMFERMESRGRPMEHLHRMPARAESIHQPLHHTLCSAARSISPPIVNHQDFHILLLLEFIECPIEHGEHLFELFRAAARCGGEVEEVADHFNVHRKR